MLARAMDHDSFATFTGTRHFPALDGLRAAAVLLVVTTHLHSAAWRPLAGRQGVIAFFVLSGFIITTLLLREEAMTGRISLRGFYVRRAFRIVPLYALVLAVYVVAVLALDFEPDKRAGLRHALPYFLTFTNELVIYGDGARDAIPFYQSWSLGVEEKFYVLWPLIGFLLLGRVSRLAALFGVTAAACMVQAVANPNWTRWYAPILVGCLLAALMHRPDAFARLQVLGRPGGAAGAVAALVATHVIHDHDRGLGELLYPFAVASLLVVLVTGGSPVRGALGSRVAAYVGTRAYGVYLVHILVINAIDRVVRPDASLTPRTVLNYLAVAGLSVAVADVLHRTVERPFIALGRRTSARLGPRTTPGTVAAAAPADAQPASA